MYFNFKKRGEKVLRLFREGLEAENGTEDCSLSFHLKADQLEHAYN